MLNINKSVIRTMDLKILRKLRFFAQITVQKLKISNYNKNSGDCVLVKIVP
jgi:hypothetical protein